MWVDPACARNSLLTRLEPACCAAKSGMIAGSDGSTDGSCRDFEIPDAWQSHLKRFLQRTAMAALHSSGQKSARARAQSECKCEAQNTKHLFKACHPEVSKKPVPQFSLQSRPNAGRRQLWQSQESMWMKGLRPGTSTATGGRSRLANRSQRVRSLANASTPGPSASSSRFPGHDLPVSQRDLCLGRRHVRRATIPAGFSGAGNRHRVRPEAAGQVLVVWGAGCRDTNRARLVCETAASRLELPKELHNVEIDLTAVLDKPMALPAGWSSAKAILKVAITDLGQVALRLRRGRPMWVLLRHLRLSFVRHLRLVRHRCNGPNLGTRVARVAGEEGLDRNDCGDTHSARTSQVVCTGHAPVQPAVRILF